MHMTKTRKTEDVVFETVKRIALDLKLERVGKRLKQIHVAKRAGLDQSRLSNIENGKAVPTSDELVRIRRALAASEESR